MEIIENIIAEEEFNFVKKDGTTNILKMQIGQAIMDKDGFYSCSVHIILDDYTRKIRSSGQSSYEAVKSAIELLSINFYAYKKDGLLFIGDWNVDTILPKDYWDHNYNPGH